MAIASSLGTAQYMTKTGNYEVVGREDTGNTRICGPRYSVVERMLKPGEKMQAEPGVMMYKHEKLKMTTKFAGFSKAISGEGLAKTVFTNESKEDQYLGLTPNMPFAIILPFCPEKGSLNCKRGSFMAGDPGIIVSAKILPANSCMACCCGGMPPIIQNVAGTGQAYLNAGGTVVKKDLTQGEKLVVDTNSVVAFTDAVSYDVQRVGSFLACCCGGEGCFNTTLTGPGQVFLQTVSYESLMKKLVVEQGSNDDKGGGVEGAEMVR